MHAARFSVVGGLAGVVMSMTTGWVITGYLCHRFQKATPMTWRDEVWLQHALAVLLSGIGGATLGALDAKIGWSNAAASSAMLFAVMVWGATAGPVIATLATYVNMHRVVVAGLLLEWLLFAIGVSLACWRWAA